MPVQLQRPAVLIMFIYKGIRACMSQRRPTILAPKLAVATHQCDLCPPSAVVAFDDVLEIDAIFARAAAQPYR